MQVASGCAAMGLRQGVATTKEELVQPPRGGWRAHAWEEVRVRSQEEGEVLDKAGEGRRSDKPWRRWDLRWCRRLYREGGGDKKEKWLDYD